LHGTNGYKDKLTHAGFYGIDMSVNTLEDFLGIKIDYYVKVGFQSVIKLVDLVGGIDVYSDTAFYSHCGDGGAQKVYVKVGMNHFNGAQALSYARERYAYYTGDIHRTQNQQQVIEAVLNKMVTNKSLLLKYDSLLNSFSELYKTNIPKELITLVIKNQINDMSGWTIEKQSLNGYHSSGYTYSWANKLLYVMQPDYNSVNSGVNKINEVLNATSKKDYVTGEITE
jgi:LCP family protein required for cell wall assembly